MEWQKRLYNHEQAPPPDLWPAVSERLRKAQGTLAGRFADHEAPPPDDAWPAISQSIRNTDRKDKGILRRLAGWTIPAAAACLAYLAIRLFAPASPSVVAPHATTALSRAPFVKRIRLAPQPGRDPREWASRRRYVTSRKFCTGWRFRQKFVRRTHPLLRN